MADAFEKQAGMTAYTKWGLAHPWHVTGTPESGKVPPNCDCGCQATCGRCGLPQNAGVHYPNSIDAPCPAACGLESEEATAEHRQLEAESLVEAERERED